MNAIAQEMARRETAKQRVLRELLLHRADGVTNHDLRQAHIGGSRAMGRVNELIHDDGYPIEVTHERGATWRVRMRPAASVLPAVQAPLLPRRERPRARVAQARLF